MIVTVKMFQSSNTINMLTTAFMGIADVVTVAGSFGM
jgi:hypothetical protein